MILSNLYFKLVNEEIEKLNKEIESDQQNPTNNHSLYDKIEQLKKKCGNILVLYYFIFTVVICFFGCLFFYVDNVGDSFIDWMNYSIRYIFYSVPIIVIVLPKYISLWILIAKKPNEIYRINALNIYRHYFKEKYVLTASKLYEHCQRRMTILTFIISLFIAFLTFLPSIVTYIFQDINNQLHNIKYNDILEEVNRQIFPPFLALFLILILFIIIYYLLNYITTIFLKRYCDDLI